MPKRGGSGTLPLGLRAAKDGAASRFDYEVACDQKGGPPGLVRKHVANAKLGKEGACHLFRHTMATLMHENGADIRCIQQLLGHEDIRTTQIYTRVAIRRLQEVHAATHPAAGPKGRRQPGLRTNASPDLSLGLYVADNNLAEIAKRCIDSSHP